MQLAELKIDVNEARESIKRFPRSQEPAIRVFRAIAQGQRVINLPDSLSQAGLNDQGLPRLAISTSNECFYERNSDHHIFRFKNWGSDAIRFSNKILPKKFNQRWSSYWVSNCPPIPTEIKEQTKDDDLFCWEVSKWQKHETHQRMQISTDDPVVLRPLSGELYCVVAEWDLTELEKKIFGRIEI